MEVMMTMFARKWQKTQKVTPRGKAEVKNIMLILLAQVLSDAADIFCL
jgi:hypothetical protein